MTVFNEKYTKIMNLATEQDPELKQVLELMLKNLTKAQKKACYNEEMVHEENKVTAHFMNGEVECNEGMIFPSKWVYMTVEDGKISYTLTIDDLSVDILDEMENSEVLRLLNLNVEIEDTVESESKKIKRISQIYRKKYNLELKKQDGNYILTYETLTKGIANKHEDFEKVIEISEEELRDIANIDNTTTDDIKPN